MSRLQGHSSLSFGQKFGNLKGNMQFRTFQGCGDGSHPFNKDLNYEWSIGKPKFIIHAKFGNTTKCRKGAFAVRIMFNYT